MKKTCFSLIAIAFAISASYAQTNTFPSSGSAGIGTMSPATALEIGTGIAGQALTISPGSYGGSYRTQLGSMSNATGVLVFGNNGPNEIRFGNTAAFGTGAIYVNNTKDYSTATDGTLAMYFKYDGNVGIGTTSPGYKLDIQGTTGNLQVKSTTGTNPAYANFSNGGGGLYVGTNNSVGNSLLNAPYVPYSSAITTTNATSLILGTNFNSRILIDTSGNVGIGTTSPAGLLDVDGLVYVQGSPTLNNNGTNSTIYTGSSFFQVVNASGSTNLLTVLNGGNVGIGITSPTAKLSVSGPVFSDNEGNNSFAINSSGVNYGLISNNAAGIWSLGYGASMATLGTPVLAWNSSGNVGIGTTIPDEKLSVLGTIHANEVKVDLSVPGPDYVFDAGYKLPTLDALKAYVDRNHHLPDMPSAAEMAKNGLSLGDLNTRLLRKVEELSLYLIEKDKQVNNLQDEITQLKQSQQKELDELKKQVSTLIQPKP